MVIESVLLVLAGYLLGSIPTAYLAGKWLKGLDLRRCRSSVIDSCRSYQMY
jgi:glycerol-3-phosphate acyltransferase PlsY